MAYNKDFNLYINEATKEAGLPIDDGMDWAKWIESVWSRSMPATPEDIRDEAIHDLLIKLLFDRKIMDRFDPSRLSAQVKARPLEKQVSSYVKMALIKNIGASRKYIEDTYHTDQEFPASGLSDQDKTLDQIFETVTHHEVNQDVESIIHADLQKFRDAFHSWMDANQDVQSIKRTRVKDMFDLTLLFDGGQGELIQEFANKYELSRARAAQIFYTELPKYLRQFSATPEGKMFSLAQQIPSMIEEDKIEQEAQTHTEPILEEDPMSKTTSKYASFKQIASEEPAALSEALTELSQAFSTLAEASEALVENLDLNPVPTDGTIKEKTAARKKFARMLKKLASENPEAVEEAVNEIYNAVDEVAAAIENLADNMGFELHEIEESDVVEFEGTADPETAEEMFGEDGDDVVYEEDEEDDAHVASNER